MNGSEKQVEWANQIKSQALKNNRGTDINFEIECQESRIANKITRNKPTLDIDLEKAKLNDLLKIRIAIESCDDAKWFIDNRSEFNSMGSSNVEKLTGFKSEYRDFFETHIRPTMNK